MASNTQPEFWLRGPVEGIPPALMPAAHAFLQTLEDVEGATADLSEEQLWARPGGRRVNRLSLDTPQRQHRQAPDLRAR